MDVRCPQCNTLYELDDGQLRSATATLKCSQCQHVFRLEAPARVSQENHRRWMIRRDDTGDVLYFASFDTLHTWLMERKVGRADAISRTGKKWVPLHSIGEFAPVFQVVDSISSLTGADPLPPRANENSAILNRVPSDAGLPSQGQAEAADTSGARKRVRTNLQYAGAGKAPPAQSERSEEKTQRSRPPLRTPSPTPIPDSGSEFSPAAPNTSPPGRPRVQLDSDMFRSAGDRQGDGWELGVDGPFSTHVDHSETHQLPRLPPRRGPRIALGLVIALLAGGAYLWFFQRESVHVWITPATSDPVSLNAPAPDPTSPSAAEEPAPEATSLVHAALESALTKKAHREAQILGGAIVSARELRAEAASAAGLAATKAAETPSASDLVASAHQALERGQHDRARSLFHRALEAKPADVEAITGLGWSLMGLGQASAAAAQFRKAIHHDRRFGDAYIGLGSAERQLGNLQAAYDAYQNYLGVHPQGPKASIASYQIAQLQKQLGM